MEEIKLPEPSRKKFPFTQVDFEYYTAEQVRQAVLAERHRAKMACAGLEVGRGDDWSRGYDCAIADCQAAIHFGGKGSE